MTEVIVSLVQLQARRDKAESMKALLKLVERVPDEGIIAIPEYSMFDPTGLDPESIARGAETLEGPWIRELRSVAKKKSSCIAATFFEENPGGKPYNSVALIDEDGDVVGVYRKTHLFDALGYRESSIFSPGRELFTPVELCGVKVGLAVCFEVRYPEIFRYQAVKGAELVIVPSAWYTGPGKEEQYLFLAQARAHENTMWLAAPILYGERFTGRSLIVNPLGVVVRDAGYGETIASAPVDTGEVFTVRERLPLLALRRPELYG